MKKNREQPGPGISLVDPKDVPEVVSVLCEAFFDYPVMRFVLGDGPRYVERLETLVRFFVMARALREEMILGVPEGKRLAAAALVSRSGSRRSPAALADLREETWTALGSDARTRYESFGEAAGRHAVDRDHLHLNMIGVRRARQGRGLGRRLLGHVHARSAADPTSTGVSLTTEVRSNVSLYRHFGYRVLGSSRVGSAFTTWAMFRQDGGSVASGRAVSHDRSPETRKTAAR